MKEVSEVKILSNLIVNQRLEKLAILACTFPSGFKLYPLRNINQGSNDASCMFVVTILTTRKI